MEVDVRAIDSISNQDKRSMFVAALGSAMKAGNQAEIEGVHFAATDLIGDGFSANDLETILKKPAQQVPLDILGGAGRGGQLLVHDNTVFGASSGHSDYNVGLSYYKHMRPSSAVRDETDGSHA